MRGREIYHCRLHLHHKSLPFKPGRAETQQTVRRRETETFILSLLHVTVTLSVLCQVKAVWDFCD